MQTEMKLPGMVPSKQEIQELLRTSDKALVRALVIVYENQTEMEKATATSQLRNDRGFTHADARIMTSFAKFYQAKLYLSEAQMHFLRNKNRLAKYWGQLQKAAEAKLARHA